MSLSVVLLGDSIAYGQGATFADHTPAVRLAAELAARGVDVRVRVHARPGARSSGLRAQVGAALGTEGGCPPAVAVIVVGANDLTHRTPALVAVRQLRDAVRRLRAAGVEVVLAPAPDLSVVPHVPEQMRAAVQAASSELRTAQTRAVLDLGGRVADRDDATTRAFAADRSLFSEDAFHPSSAGYAVIVDALLPEVLCAVRAAGG